MRHDTKYTIFFTIAVCLVCSVFVSSAAVLLKDLQEQNILLDRHEKVLEVAGLRAKDQQLSAGEVDAIFQAKIRPELIELATGETAEGLDPASYDQRKAEKDPALSEAIPPNKAKVRRLPRYALIYKVVDGEELRSIILPIEGKGLWSTLYGYLSLAPDGHTIQSIIFYEHGETPGLGGEIDNPRWRAVWKGRKIFDDEGVVRIQVKKGPAGPPDQDPNRVDGLSGATLTSHGVTDAVQFWMSDQAFGPYLAKLQKERDVL